MTPVFSDMNCWVHNVSTSIWSSRNTGQYISVFTATTGIPTVCTGPRHMEGKTWHPQLSDKAASIKTHHYWAMKNSGGNSQVLRDMILNIVEHYENDHSKCHATSRCQIDPNYEPSKH
ncbi:hypothetical protein BaRGS_00026850 [Batillaria attramentaria]|uniref:Uncharacterized protein n=1 Tax=Batillaria attramentaria TaxID=370345 RepID=A0ABD0K3F9_9CAEN